MSTTLIEQPVTQPQRNYIEGLLEKQDVEPAVYNTIKLELANKVEPMSKTQASKYITDLKARGPKKVANAVTEPGMYEAKGIVYQVVKAKPGHLYAKHLTPDGWGWAKGAMGKLRADDRITVERAIELSSLRGQCIRCLKTLIDPKYVEKGMGKVCLSKI